MEQSAQVSQNPSNSLFASFYKDVWRKMIPNGLTDVEVELIIDAAKLAPGNRVLDIMCGYGRHAIGLARKGFDVTALDNLDDYIQEIEKTARQENLPINPQLQDISEAQFTGVYDAVICMGNCFSNLDQQNVTKVLANLSRHIKLNGRLVINSWMIGEIAIKHFEAKTWLYVDEFKYLLDNKYLFNPTRVETHHILIREDGQVQTLHAIDYIFTFSELEALLNSAGFQTVERYATPKKKKFQFGDKQVYIVAEKMREV
jgi:2-polyprenyl-3-methyl-5-hydroxy-6-metoxy-1,4-benzoquinol methylase